MHPSAPPRRGSKQQNNFEGWKRKIRRWSRNSRSRSTGKLFCKGDGGVGSYFARVKEEWEVICKGERKVGNFL